MLGRAIFALVTLVLAIELQAQGIEGKGPQTGRPPGFVRTRSVDERVDTFAKKIGLTPTQKSKVKKITIDSNTKLESLAKNSKLKPDERQKRVDAVIRASQVQIRMVLDSKQKVKYDAMLKEYEATRAKFRTNPPAPGNGNRPKSKKPS